LSGETPVSALVKQMAAQPAMILVVILLYFLQAGLEDLGWRGYMLERLLKNWTPVKSALLVGIFHSFWHLPMFWVVGTNQIKMGFGFDFGLFIAQAVAFSIYASWCYVDNSHSTLAAILLHTTGNLSNDIFTLEAGTMSYQVYTLLMVVGAIIISLVWLKRASNHPCISQA
jgi:membrane protease YdiL (CAAX protease family)